VNLFPTAMSAPFWRACLNLGISLGSCCPSASSRTAYSALAFKAACISVRTAAP